MHAPCGTRIHTGRFGVSYPILLDERSVFPELPAPDSNRHMRQSKCRALAFWRADNSYPGRTRTASYETQNLAPYQFGDRALFQPAAEKHNAVSVYGVSRAVWFTATPAKPSTAPCLGTACPVYGVFVLREVSCRSHISPERPGKMGHLGFEPRPR